MLPTLKKSILLLVTLWTISVVAQVSTYVTVCRRCDNTHVSYTFDSPSENIHVQAQAPGIDNCTTRTTARSAEGAVFEDEGLTPQGNMAFVVSAPGYSYTCRNYNSVNSCCTGPATKI
jgi:chitodextrinase